MPESTSPLLAIEGLGKIFTAGQQSIHAVQDVSLDIHRGEIVGIVGESGSGKTTFGRCVLRLTEPSQGRIEFDGVNLTHLEGAPMRNMRRRMQMIFQDPYASLNPRMTVERIIAEPLDIHQIGTVAERRARVGALLREVDLPLDSGSRYPHEFSGGQRQRIGIARALAVKPDLIVADEPVSALDVSIQAQVVNLLKDLQQRYHLTMLFISHDLNVVNFLCDRVLVMYLGRVMESGPARLISNRPAHPYTQALLSANPHLGSIKRQRITLSGDLPSPANPPSGCVFRTRCPYAQSRCAEEIPQLRQVAGENKQQVACHFFEQL
ncbi:MAG: peptide transporter ATP-binding protein [Proteobacteria bacterium]|nr:peptide transporter ATP-binding protein [Pseudomonadota bacterium]